MYLVQMATFDFQLETLSPEEKAEMRRINCEKIRRTIVPKMGLKVLRYQISPNQRVSAEDSSKRSLNQAEAWAQQRGIEPQEHI